MVNSAYRILESKPAFRLVGIVLALVAIGAGCTQRTYRARDLPAELLAPPVTNLDQINLSRLADGSVTSEVIDWGDILEIRVDSGLATLEPIAVQLRVAKDGAVCVPLIGKVAVAGLEVEAAEQAIIAAARARDVFPNPYVALTIHQQRMNKVTVVGAVEEPGVKELPRGSSSLLAGLMTAGGLSSEASPNVEIRRAARHRRGPGLLQPDGPRIAGGPQAELVAHHLPYAAQSPEAALVLVDLATGEIQGENGRRLEDGDVVYVPKRPLQPVYVLGLVNKPGEFELPANKQLRLLDALALAGGRSNQVADKVLILRRLPGRESPITISASIAQAAQGGDNLALAPGDTVIVRQTPETVLVDIMKNFLRFGVSGSVPLF